MLLLDICENSSVLNVVYIVKIITLLICIIVPIILMLSLMIKIVKELVNTKDDVIENILKTSSRKMIATVALFLVPTFVNILTSITPGNDGYLSCYESATPEYIASKAEEEKIMKETNLEKYKEYNRKLAEEVQRREDQRRQEENNGNGGSGGGNGSGDGDGSGGGSAGTPSAGSYRNWKQCDSRWGENKMGVSRTICNAGCTSTSVAMALAKSNVKTNLSTELSPASFVDWMNKNGGYSGNDLCWGIVTNLAPSFKFVGKTVLTGTVDNKRNQIRAALERGEYVICAVNNGGHWVLVDYIEGDHVYILDPGEYGKTDLFEFDGVVQYDSYRVG